ncbi:hypothetical protein A4G20_05740 [Pasteurellaceae bacterium RH1A]|nr:hypothetical protein A4G20_05740 [Pasteurellaceae bacterium RH1A]
MKKHLLLLLFPATALALPKLDIKPAEPTLPSPQAVQISPNLAKSEKLTLSEELRANPELTRQMINRAIDSQQFELLPELLRIYEQTPQPDKVLIDYAKGIILSQQGELDQAIRLYRGIIAQYPNFQPVRLRLAQFLFADQQNEAALDQFRKLQAEPLPPEIANRVDQYLAALIARSSWHFNFGLTYVRENNVNNASKARYIYLGNVPFEKNSESLPQKANGLSYHFNLARSFNLLGSHYLHVENQFSGKSYWDNHAFDDQQNRTSLGYQFQNAQSRLALLPFYEMRWYGNHRYNRGYGLRVEAEHWLSPRWQVSLAGEVGQLKYRAGNTALNGTNGLVSATLLHAFNAKSYLYGGVDFLRDLTQDRRLASKRYSGRLGWSQEWWWGISSRMQVSYGKRKFDQKHALFNRLRQDRELDVSLTLWHRNLHFWGITPKLTYSYRRVNSNLPDLYGYDRKRFYVSFERSF